MFLKQLDSGLFQGIPESSDYTLDSETVRRLAEADLSTELGKWLKNHEVSVAQCDPDEFPSAAETSSSTGI